MNVWALRRTSTLLLAAAVLCSACADEAAIRSQQTGVEQAPRLVVLGGPVTEVVYALGAGEQVVGVDISSVHPEAALRLPNVGYYRQFSAEGVLGLRPTLVLASDQAGPAAAVEQLRGGSHRLEVIPVAEDLAAARHNVERIAAVLGRDPTSVLAAMDRDVAELETLRARVTTSPRVLFVYARGPGRLLVGGRGTAAAEVLRLVGAVNAGEALEGMKPWSAEAVVAAAPDVIVLPSRGLDSIGGAAGLFALPGLAQTPAGHAQRVVSVDDLKLLGFGPRIGQGLKELLLGLHPQLAPTVNL